MSQTTRAGAQSGLGSANTSKEARWFERRAFVSGTLVDPRSITLSPAAQRASALLSERLGSRDFDLPPFPQQIFALIELLRDPNVDSQIVQEHLRSDPVVAAEVLRFANSGLYAPTTRIADLKHAVGFLGFRRLRALALGIGVKVAAGNVVEKSTAKLLWLHSVGVGMLSTALARALRIDDESAFLGGLLHDVGKIASASEVKRLEKSHPLDLTEADRAALLEVHHVSFGLSVAQLWKLPTVVQGVIGQLHGEAAPDTDRRLVALVDLADKISYGLGLGPAIAPFDLFALPALQTLGLTRESAETLFEDVVPGVVAEVSVLQ